MLHQWFANVVALLSKGSSNQMNFAYQGNLYRTNLTGLSGRPMQSYDMGQDCFTIFLLA